MTKGVMLEYHTFDENGVETIKKEMVYRIYLISLPTSKGMEDVVVLGVDPKLDKAGKTTYSTKFIKADDRNYVEFLNNSYSLSNISQLTILCNDVKTELDIINIV
ncbi:MAG: hypothetical protein J6T10_17300 [Methanobrevibacter sp.]|nr:hypothetical protein [Methanobrevibacter sp.]